MLIDDVTADTQTGRIVKSTVVVYNSKPTKLLKFNKSNYIVGN